MVQLVYVHGVANRKDDQDFESDRVKRRKMFEKGAFNGNELTFRDPYWGGFGADPKFDFASIPKQKGTVLAVGGGIGGSIGGVAAAPPPSNDTWLQAAGDEFLAVVHTLSLALNDEDENQSKLADGLVGYALSLEREGKVATPAWVANVNDDDAFLHRLEKEAKAWSEAQGVVTLGVGDTLRGVGRSIVSGASNLVNGPIAKGVRALTPQIGIFIGDVFKYLRAGDARKKIRAAVDKEIVEAAKAAQQNGEKLVLFGHSLGGVILYDMLGDPAYLAEVEAKLGQRLAIDLLVTIGSQPGLFEELDLFVSSTPGQKGKRPPSVARWWNIYDRVDVLSFAASKVFDDVVDLEADTIASIAKAHGAYLRSKLVHERLHRRMKAEGLIT